jgi:hypothetical protein
MRFARAYRQLRAFRQLHAPQEDGGRLIEPAWSSLPEIVANSAQPRTATSIEILGKPLDVLASAARGHLLEQARRYTSQYCDLDAPVDEPNAPIVMAGHQPQLFHPGVWYKNFALARLAAEAGATAVNLIIDSDLCRETSIRVPTGSGEAVYAVDVPFDEPAADVPFEERRTASDELLGSFAERVSQALEPLVAEPLVRTYWPMALARHREEPNLGRCLAQGRHGMEREWMRDKPFRPALEIPQSVVCQSDEFRTFAAHILANLASFVAAHNGALADYRHAHRLRSHSHPVPDLAMDDDWQEAPFWIWSTADPARRAVYARREAGEVVLTDRRQFTSRLRFSADGSATSAVEQLAALETDGVKLRTRALTTTLFARVVLSDFFIHGIGGAKYDEVTDQIVRTFFGIEPPEYGVVSATLRLPVAHETTTADAERQIARQLRDLTFNPDRHVDPAIVSASQLSTVSGAIEEKRRWIATRKTVANALQRHQAIVAANVALQPVVARQRSALGNQLADLHRRQRVARVLENREYAFCLFPESTLQGLLLDSWGTSP